MISRLFYFRFVCFILSSCGGNTDGSLDKLIFLLLIIGIHVFHTHHMASVFHA